MIEISHVHVDGFEAAVRGMRNPMNSWDKSDSNFKTSINEWHTWIGANDKRLMLSLVKAGPDHRKFLRMINVTMDIKAPLYWWKEFDTYKVGTVANSCSTMHMIHDKEFTLDVFSHEHLCEMSIKNMNEIIAALNKCRELYLQTKDKKYWWQMIQLLPSSYNQLRTVQLNYEVLYNIYFARRDHKLDEWVYFCLEITKLPLMPDFLNAK
jgi:hypothetical protein